MEIKIPHGKSFQKFVPGDFSKITVLESQELPSVRDEEKAIKDSLQNPIGTKRLSSIANLKDAIISIVVNDITRPSPTKLFLNTLVEELKIGGASEKNIRVVVATGCHRGNTKEELELMIGKENVERFYVENHICNDENKLEYIGETNCGCPIVINKTVAKSDVRILTGVIVPHHSAGFSGGRKSIVPGVAGIDTLKRHHSMPIRPYNPAMGFMEENPFHKISLEIAKKLGVNFILNVVQNSKKETIAAVAGDLEKAHKAGVDISRKNSEIKIKERAEIVVTSPGGFPRDINLYQSQKAVSVAERVVKENGVIILVANCQEGIKKGDFLDWMLSAKNPKEIIDRFLEEGYTLTGSHKAFLFARALVNKKIIVVTENIEEDVLNKMFMERATSLEEAISMALEYCGSHSKIYCLPKAINLIPIIEGDSHDNN